MDEKIHDEIRGKKESWKRAIQGFKHTLKDAWYGPLLKYYCWPLQCSYTDHFKQLLDYSRDQKL